MAKIPSPTASAILLLGILDDLWKDCFGEDDQWPCQLLSLPESCSSDDLERVLSGPGLHCVVIDDIDCPHLARLKKWYNENEGFLVFFAIEGVYELPNQISREFGVSWQFSAYTKHEYILTEAGKEILGDAITEQQYSKANLLAAPPEDRIIVPKPDYASAEEYMNEEAYSDDEGDLELWRSKYDTLVENLGNQVPVALHRASHGGWVCYLGWVNGDGNIPKIVRALCTKSKIAV